nr:uncharacterized protein LOC112061480 [Chrysemys picta bellii]
MAAPRLVPVGVELGVLLQAEGAAEQFDGTLYFQNEVDTQQKCSSEKPFSLRPGNGYMQLLTLKVTPELAVRCGLTALRRSRYVQLVARSPQLPTPGARTLRLAWTSRRGAALHPDRQAGLHAPAEGSLPSLRPEPRAAPHCRVHHHHRPEQPGAAGAEGGTVPAELGHHGPALHPRHLRARDLAHHGAILQRSRVQHQHRVRGEEIRAPQFRGEDHPRTDPHAGDGRGGPRFAH